jgi:hypothetical protein
MEPVFIGGADRSGTSLLASLLGAHSAALTIPEAQFLTRHLRDERRARADGSGSPSFARSLSGYRFRLWNLPPQTVDLVDGQDAATGMRTLVSSLAHTRGVNPAKLRVWVDHTPSNLHDWNVLDEAFPECKFIHIVRDGRAVAGSLKSMRWGPNDVEASARWWLSRLSTALMCELALGEDRTCRIRFEDVVADPAGALESLCRFIGIDYESPMAAGGGYCAPDYWNHGHGLVSASPNPSRISAWRSQLPPSDIERFEAIAGPALEFFSYELQYGGGAKPSGSIERLRRGFSEFVRFYLLNPPRHLFEILRAMGRIWRDSAPAD